MKNIFVVLAFFVASVFNVSFAQEQLTDSLRVEEEGQIWGTLSRGEIVPFEKVFKPNTHKALFEIIIQERYNPKYHKELLGCFINDNQEVSIVEGGYLIFPPSKHQTNPQFYSKKLVKRLLR